MCVVVMGRVGCGRGVGMCGCDGVYRCVVVMGCIGCGREGGVCGCDGVCRVWEGGRCVWL